VAEQEQVATGVLFQVNPREVEQALKHRFLYSKALTTQSQWVQVAHQRRMAITAFFQQLLQLEEERVEETTIAQLLLQEVQAAERAAVAVRALQVLLVQLIKDTLVAQAFALHLTMEPAVAAELLN
jgi:hypothetical protein